MKDEDGYSYRTYLALLEKELVTAPTIGATRMSHLKDAAGALSIKVNKSEVLKIAHLVGIKNPLI